MTTVSIPTEYLKKEILEDKLHEIYIQKLQVRQFQ